MTSYPTRAHGIIVNYSSRGVRIQIKQTVSRPLSSNKGGVYPVQQNFTETEAFAPRKEKQQNR